MSSSEIHILFIADVVGYPGFQITEEVLPGILEKHHIDLTVANGENATGGKGLTPNVAKSLFNLGIDVITSGNHIWNKKQIVPELEEHPNILRPLNYPPSCPGKGSCTFEIPDGPSVGVINLQGRSFMYPIDCPFRAADAEVTRMRDSGIGIIVIDCHAEATAEKIALARHLDGRISGFIGTHTHVQTADEQILPSGTAYITDIGMTGPIDSVIGMHIDSAIERFITQRPVYYKIAAGPAMLCGVVVTVGVEDGKAKSISRLRIP